MVEELGAIRTGIVNFAQFMGKPSYSPKLVLFIAVKRHNKRFVVEDKTG